MEFQLTLLLDSLDPYWSGKHEIRLFLGILVHIWGSQNAIFSILKSKNITLHKVIKTNHDHLVAPFFGLKSQNIDRIPLPGNAVSCANFYFHSYETEKITDLSEIINFHYLQTLHSTVYPLPWIAFTRFNLKFGPN